MCFHFLNGMVANNKLPVDAEEIFGVHHLFYLVQIKIHRKTFAFIGTNKIGFVLGIKISYVRLYIFFRAAVWFLKFQNSQL
jgi:hypothetical protein